MVDVDIYNQINLISLLNKVFESLTKQENLLILLNWRTIVH